MLESDQHRFSKMQSTNYDQRHSANVQTNVTSSSFFFIRFRLHPW